MVDFASNSAPLCIKRVSSLSSSTRWSYSSAFGATSICSVESVVSFILSRGHLNRAHMLECFEREPHPITIITGSCRRESKQSSVFSSQQSFFRRYFSSDVSLSFRASLDGSTCLSFCASPHCVHITLQLHTCVFCLFRCLATCSNSQIDARAFGSKLIDQNT